MRTGASILLLDEPLTGLDSAGATDLLCELRRIQREEAVTLVISEHDLNLGLLLDLATTVWTLAEGTLQVQDIESVRSEILSRSCDPADEWSSALQSPNAHRVDLDLGFGARLTVWGAADARDIPVLSLERLVVRRARGIQVPPGAGDGVSFALWAGQFALLSAPNGWGKSTMLEAVAGLVPASHGAVRIRDRDVAALSPWRRSCSLLRERARLFPHLSVHETLLLGRRAEPPAAIAERLDQRVGELSGGERQLLALALAFDRRNCAVHLLDEPLTGLDVDGRREVFDRIRRLLSVGAVLVAVPARLAARDVIRKH